MHVDYWFHAKGVRLAADVAGPEEGQPVIYLHGGGQTRHSWGKAIKSAGAAGYRAYAVDLRGHGDSERSPNGTYTISDLTADATAMARSLNRPPVLVGASLGGIMSMRAVGESPNDLAAGLVLVDIAARTEKDGRNRIADFMRARPEGFASLEDAADFILEFLPHRKRATNLEGLKKNLRQRAGRWYWHWDPAMLASLNPNDVTELHHLEKAARAIRIPTLLLRGAQSDVVSEEGVAHFLELVPHAEFIDVQNTGHMIAGDANDIFDTVVMRFLNCHWPAR